MPTEPFKDAGERSPSSRLCGELTVVRPLTTADLPFLKAWDEDPEIVALMGRKYASTDVEVWYESISAARNYRALAIETMEGRLIGELELAQVNWRRGSAELRICIGEKDCWGCGYGSDALQATLNLAFERYGLRSVYLRVFASNVRAIRLYKRVGFRTEASLEPSERRGDPSAVLLMNLSRERWIRYRSQLS